jgi:hypothetical protein
MQVIFDVQNSGATISTVLVIIYVGRTSALCRVTASYTRVHIKRISWSNTDVVDYKVTSKVPVTSTPKLRALLPLYYSKTVAVGPRPVTFHQRGTVSAPQCWIDEYSNLRKKTFRHKRVLHSAGCLFQNIVICDTRGAVVSFSLSQDSLTIYHTGNRF